MSANEIQQSLLSAMELLSDNAANSTNAAITIKGEIIEELDSGLHQYSVSYGGAIYKDVYSMANTTYSSSTVVYILVPDGDFDQPKIILGTAIPSASVFVEDSETESYIPVSDNLIGDGVGINLQSWLDKDYSTITIKDSFNSIFADYLNTYKNFLFTAYIKTEINVDHQTGGNYGLKLNLPFIRRNASDTSGSEEIYLTYIMDVSTMQGNPYAFNEYQRVNLYYEIDDTLTYDTSRPATIIPFTQGFGYITPPTEIESDIHIQNIGIKIIDVLEEAETTGYHLSVVSDSGNYFLGTDYARNKILTPLLKVNGKETKYTSYSCYWFIEDSSITTSSEDYSTLGGLGWKCINEKTNITYDANGKKTFQYITNNYSLIVKPSIFHEKFYMNKI